MHSGGAVIDVAQRKALLRALIAERRATCARAASQAAGPLRWLDRAWLRWRKLSPLARLAASLTMTVAGTWLARPKVQRSGGWFAAFAWGLRAVRLYRGWRISRRDSPRY